MGEGETSTTSLSAMAFIGVASRTDIGMKREENQDSHGLVENSFNKAFIVADGMGGVKGGAVASGIAIDVFREKFASGKISDGVIEDAIKEANARIFKEALSKPAFTGMGTTCVGLIFRDAELRIFNVGDSRAYRIRNGSVLQLTEDHTLVQELLKTGTISQEQAQNHPVSHMLTRSLGPQPEVEPDLRGTPDPVQVGDRYLICSDGLYNLVPTEEIGGLIRETTIDAACRVLIDKANERGGTDNITVVIAEVLPGYPGNTEVELPQEEAPKKETPPEEPQERVKLNEDEPGESPKVEPSVSFKKLTEVTDELRFAQTEAAEKQPKIEPEEVHIVAPPWVGGSLVGPLVLGAVLLAGIVVGASFFGGTSITSRAPVLTSNEGEVVKDPTIDALKAEVERLRVNTTGTELPSIKEPPTVDAHEGISHLDTQPVGGFSASQREKIDARKKLLVQKISDIEKKVRALNEPFGASNSFDTGSDKLKLLEEQLTKLKEDMDLATRKLALWHQRRKQLKDTDPVNLAAPVALSSVDVKSKHEAFKEVTAKYIAEAEAHLLNPTNQAQSDRVTALVAERKQKMGVLSEAIRNAIEAEISSTDQKVADLAVQRDRIEQTLNARREDKAFVEILKNEDQGARSTFKDNLIKEKALAEEELQSLIQLLSSSESSKK